MRCPFLVQFLSSLALWQCYLVRQKLSRHRLAFERILVEIVSRCCNIARIYVERLISDVLKTLQQVVIVVVIVILLLIFAIRI